MNIIGVEVYISDNYSDLIREKTLFNLFSKKLNFMKNQTISHI